MIHLGIDLLANNMVIVAIDGNGGSNPPGEAANVSSVTGGFLSALLPRLSRPLWNATNNWDWCRSTSIELTLTHAKMVKAISR